MDEKEVSEMQEEMMTVLVVEPTQGRAASTAVPMPLWNISRVKSWRCATGRGFTKSTS